MILEALDWRKKYRY